MDTPTPQQLQARVAAMKSPLDRDLDALGTGAMTVLIITSVVSLRGLASQAVFGFTSIFYYLLAAVFYLVPFALVCGELASALPGKGGIFLWVSTAWGKRTGWVAMFMEWWWVVIWYPTVLIFGSVALAYVLGTGTEDAALASDRWWTLGFVLAVFWAATLNTCRGLKKATRVAAIGGLTGTIIPGAILIVLGAVYVFAHKGPLELPLHASFWPDFSKFDTLVLAASIFLFFGGIEVQAPHVPRMKDPARQFPRALITACVAILLIFILGTLAIGAVVPESQINLTQTLLVAYRRLWEAMGVPWLGHVMAVLIAVGVIGQISAVIAGPTIGLAQVGDQGYLPKSLQRHNSHGMPSRLLVVQAMIVTGVTVVLMVLPSVESAYQLIGQMSAIVYLLLILVVYMSCLRLRRHFPALPRPFHIPGGKAGIWTVTLVGMVGAVVALVFSFMPPSQISVGSPTVWVCILAGATILCLALALWLWHVRPARLTPPGQA